jgi:diguanylate cyclase (GGDEF)-like protein
VKPLSSENSTFYAAIGLTSQRDCYSLTRHLIELLQSLTFMDRAQAFEAYRVAGSKDEFVFRRFTDDLTEQRVPPDCPGLAEGARRKLPMEVAAPGNGVRLVFPVESASGPLRLVVLDGQVMTPEERVLLMNLVTLYTNQVNIMDSKERDALTGLLNRQTFDLRLMQVTQWQEQGSAWLGTMDIDHFKRVNDTYGHLYGDEVLLHFAQHMERHFRYTDFLFRFGGEEFIVLLTNTDAQGARQALERFRRVISEFDFPAVGRVTVSIGYTRIEPGTLPTTLVDWSDRALYYAKEHGRNQVVFYDDIRPFEESGAGTDVELF